MTSLHNLNCLLENDQLDNRHPLNKLSKDDMIIVDKAIGIVRDKHQDSGKSMNEFRGRLCDPKSFLGLSGELFWCHRLAQLGYSFQMEGEDGGVDFRIVLGSRTIIAEVKTLQKRISINPRGSVLYDDKFLKNRLKKANKQVKSKKNEVNVIFVDSTLYPILDKEDIFDALGGKSVCHVSINRNSGEISEIETDRLDNGFFRDGSSISAVIVYQRNGMLGIRDRIICLHPRFCKLTDSEQRHLDEILKIE